MLTKFIDLACCLSPRIKQSFAKLWFQYLTKLDKEALMIYMNYGYAGLHSDANALALRDDDEKNRYCIQMYHHVAGAIDLSGLDVLEIGCGRGGGASYVMRYLQPKSLIGVDIAEKAIEFCQSHHSTQGLSFSHADAERLPFANEAFDVVVNVESSHCYDSMERFLSEVLRVLRPNGYFLFADIRATDKIDTLRKQLLSSGLALLKEEKITPNVLKALDSDNTRKLELIQQKVPRMINKRFQEFAALQGTKTYERFRSGDSDYCCFVLHKGQASKGRY